MKKLNEKYKVNISPKPDNSHFVVDGNCRFTVLCDGLIRIEYDKDKTFEDRATQVVLNRNFDSVKFQVKKDEEKIIIITDRITLTYYRGCEFAPNTLFAHFYGERSAFHFYWRYGLSKQWNLKGTTRTLDLVDGEIELEDGIMSLDGFTELDDSKSLIINDEGWIEERKECTDFYLFAYKDDYYTALKAFYTLTGNTPLLPKYALGNMWSRNWKYTQDEYISLMDKFKKENIPFSVAAVDMDWHIVDIDKKYGAGWTGYTWNENLFSNYKKFLSDLHERNLAVTLNVHPADGIRPYEKMYHEMAEALNVPDCETVEFDIADKDFLEKYFEILHNRYDKDGVDFWWIDWQQGETSKYKNLDPMWMLNHYHTLDKNAQGKRGIILSRYAGIGSHRYPIGFSGDTIISWKSLDFQPYFTANAANAGYTWWSHDIGGYIGGVRDDEMVTRWVQLGVFSPICRLHSTLDPLLSKEPWNYDELSERTMKLFLQLRHKLIPYLYTMNYRTHTDKKPLVAPLYYDYPSESYGAYDKKYRNEYLFGSEMIVMPITKKSDTTTRMGSAEMLIPDGIWFDFFNGRKYCGKKSMEVYRSINEMPVLVKAGGIIPMADGDISNDISNPKKMRIRVFAGADNEFELYEDKGEGFDYINGSYVTTTYSICHSEKPEFEISEPMGDKTLIPAMRDYCIEFVGYTNCDDFIVTENGNAKAFSVKNNCIIIENVSGNIVVRFNKSVDIKENDRDEIFDFLIRCQGNNSQKRTLYNLIKNNAELSDILMFFAKNEVDKNMKMALIELLTADK